MTKKTMPWYKRKDKRFIKMGPAFLRFNSLGCLLLGVVSRVLTFGVGLVALVPLTRMLFSFSFDLFV